MRKLLIVLSIISVLFISACTNGQIDLNKLSQEDIDKVIKCDAPYIRHASGCCLDKDNNKICDEDEGKSSNQEQPTIPQQNQNTEENSQTKESEIIIQPKQQNSVNFDLKNYPSFFIKDNKVDPSLVLLVGSKGDVSDVLAIGEITASLQMATATTGKQIINSGKDTDILGSEKEHNIIAVSGISQDGSCVNKIIEKFIVCKSLNLVPGMAIIKIVSNGEKSALFVIGKDTADTRMGSYVLTNYKNYKLEGNEVKIKGTLNSPTIIYGAKSNDNINIAIQTCQQYCDQARLLPDNLRKESSYCKSYFNIENKNTYCYDQELNVACKIESNYEIRQLRDICKNINNWIN